MSNKNKQSAAEKIKELLEQSEVDTHPKATTNKSKVIESEKKTVEHSTLAKGVPAEKPPETAIAPPEKRNLGKLIVTPNPSANSEQTQRIKSEKSGGMVFAPGVSGNPSGPKPGYHHAKTYFLKIIKEMAKTSDGKLMELGEALARAQVKIALSGDSRAFDTIFNRVDGKAPQPIIGDAEEDAVRIEMTEGMKRIVQKAYGDETNNS